MASVKIKQKKTMTKAQERLLDKIIKGLSSRVFQPAEAWPASFGATTLSPYENLYSQYLQRALGVVEPVAGSSGQTSGYVEPGYTLGEPVVPSEALHPTPSYTPEMLQDAISEALNRALSPWKKIWEQQSHPTGYYDREGNFYYFTGGWTPYWARNEIWYD